MKSDDHTGCRQQAHAACGFQSKRVKRPPSERYGWLDQWMVARGTALRGLVTAAVDRVAQIEQEGSKRIRARKQADQANHLRRIEGLIANLAYAVLAPPKNGRIAISLGHKKRSRYEHPAFGKPLSDLIYRLEDADLLCTKRSPGRGEVSSIAPTGEFARQVQEAGVSFQDFGRDPAEEVIILSCNWKEQTGMIEQEDERKRKERIDYEDNATSRRYRAAVRRLNTFLAGADITFIVDGQQPPVDPFDRALTRRFGLLKGQPTHPPRFDQVGRLFGGFWMTLSKNRREQIKVGGERVATLDYSSMFTRLAYAELGKQAPAGDLYAVPGLEAYRTGVKTAMNCFLFDHNLRRSKWPKEMGIGVGSDDEAPEDDPFKGRLPVGWGVGRTKNAILRIHPILQGAWGRGLGYRLMWRESEVLIAVLEALIRRDVVALPLHDGLLVPGSKADEAEQVMREEARAVIGVELPVSRKG